MEKSKLLTISSKTLPNDRTRFNRGLLAAGGAAYLAWWFVVESLLPGSFNPLFGRLVVVSLFFLVLILSYLSAVVRSHIGTCFSACAWIVTLHYFYLFHNNHSDVNWTIGSYIIVIALCACLESTLLLRYYVLFVTGLSLLIGLFDPVVVKTVFLSGMLTILAFAYFGMTAKLKLLKQVGEQALGLQNLFDAVFEGVVIHDQGVVIDTNQSFDKMFGYGQGEARGKLVTEFASPQAQAIVRENIGANSEMPYEAEGKRKDGFCFPIEIRGKRHFFRGKNLRIAAIRDVTEEKKVEQVRVLLNASREAIKIHDEFVLVASHELKTPLSAIKMQTQIVKRKIQKGGANAPDLESVEKVAEFIERQVDKLIRLTVDMVDVSKISLGKLDMQVSLLNFSMLAEETAKGLSEALAEAGSQLTIEMRPGVFVEGDSFRLEQVIVNLLVNSLKYGSGKPVRISLTGRDQDAVLEVEDLGIGLAKTDQARVFQRFERAVSSRDISGLGLGLFICKYIVEAHHGKIEVVSELGKGARFSVKIPIAHTSDVQDGDVRHNTTS